MPFNGSGTFQRTQNWAADAAAGVKIITPHHDDEDNNFANGLTNCITRDGQSPPVANLPMGGFRHTGAANPVNPQDYATKSSSEAFASALRSFNTGISLTGVSTGVSPNFTSLAVLGFTEADMSIVARKADPAVVPPTANRIAFNRTATGLLASDDLMYIDDNGKLVLLAPTAIYSQLDAAYPVGTIRETLIVASSTTWPVPKGLKYLEVIHQAPGGNGGACGSTGATTVAVGGAGGAGGRGRRVFTKAELSTAATPQVVITLASVGSGGTSTFAAEVGSATSTGGANGALGAAGVTSSQQGAQGGSAAGWTLNGAGEAGGVSWAGYLASDQVQVRGKGGSTPWGSGGKEVFTSGNSVGSDATGYGAGGGPAGAGHSSASMGVGNGSGGFFLLREYY